MHLVQIGHVLFGWLGWRILPAPSLAEEADHHSEAQVIGWWLVEIDGIAA